MPIQMIFALILTALITTACDQKKSSTASNPPSSTEDGGGGGGGGGGGVTIPAFGRLFPTTATTNGGFGYTGSTADMTLVADPMCATEAAALGLTGVFKAVVVSPSVRVTSSNWVLKNSTEYRRPDGTVIGTTNASGYFDFPLTNSFAATPGRFWTGMNSSWGSSAPWHCDGFTNPVSGLGNYGNLDLTGTQAVNGGMDTCDTAYALLCAEMIARTTVIPAQAAYRRIFPSTVAVVAATGLFNENSVTRFDQQCQSDADTKGISNDGRTSYKALIVTNTTNAAITRRMACLTAYCGNGAGEAVGWILEPNTEYRREDGTTIIGTTNANSIFDFPLTNSFTGVNEEYWTGNNTTWATATNLGGDQNCAFYQTNSGSTTSPVGLGDATDANSISSGSTMCNQSRKILCVEQKRTQTVYVDYPGYN